MLLLSESGGSFSTDLPQNCGNKLPVEKVVERNCTLPLHAGRHDGWEDSLSGTVPLWKRWGPAKWAMPYAADLRAGRRRPQPTVGEFKDGRGEFYDQELFNGRAILVRFVITPVTADVCRFEQSFSDDGGKNWELNWVATDTRAREPASSTR